MGCDIHIVVEKLYEDQWVGLHNCPSPPRAGTQGHAFWPIEDRNYQLFSELAGVRGDGSGPEPRGVPNDASLLSRLEIEGWGSDGHSHSWLPLREAAPLFGKYLFNPVTLKVKGELSVGWSADEQVRWRCGEHFGVNLTEEADVNNYRIVFWFDN